MPHLRRGITIDASAATVWKVLSDFEAYAEWTDDLLWATSPGEGEVVRMTIKVFGRPVTVPVLVLDIQRERRLRWRGGSRWLLSGTHYFELEAMGERTRVLQGEIFAGAGTKLVWRVVEPELLAFYDRINLALEARCLAVAAAGDAG